jgi:hypothetical protein
MTETLVGVSPSEPKDPAAGTSGGGVEAACQLVRAARATGVALTGPDGLLKALTKTMIETAFDGEMSEHLGYDKFRAGRPEPGNSRNGKRSKTVLTDACGEVGIELLRERDGSFEPVISEVSPAAAVRGRRDGAVAVCPGVPDHRGDQRASAMYTTRRSPRTPSP